MPQIAKGPRTDWLDGVIDRDERGSCAPGPISSSAGSGLPAGRLTGSLPPGVERAGGVRAGDVRAESVKRVASAVGEGVMAVTLVHRYLAEQ